MRGWGVLRRGFTGANEARLAAGKPPAQPAGRPALLFADELYKLI